MTLNNQGYMFALSSLNGKHVRIYKVENIDEIEHLKNFDRGRHEVDTYSLQFNQKSDFLTMTTDSNTIHVFPAP